MLFDYWYDPNTKTFKTNYPKTRTKEKNKKPSYPIDLFEIKNKK